MDFELTEVHINEIKCSKKYKEIIGTKGIASCIGVLIYDDLAKKAIVGHFNFNMYDDFEIEDANRIYKAIKNCIKENNMSDNISYLIVPGIVGNVDRISLVASHLETFLKNYKKMENINESAIRINEETESLEFVFDPNHNNFATDKYYPNDLNYNLSKGKSL